MKGTHATRHGSDSPADGVHLWLLLWKATKAVEANAHSSIRATGLCLSDFGVLEALLHKGPLPVSALGRKVMLTSGSMTVAVDRLERRGLVERTFSKTDRRARVVRLKDKGSKLIRTVFAKHSQDMERLFSCLDKTEKKHFANALRKLGHGASSLSAAGDNSVQSKDRRKKRS